MPSGKTSKRLRDGLTVEQHKQMQPIIHTQEISEVYQGPLPEPATLEKYKNADPSFPERIMRMAESHNAADVTTKNRISLSNLIVPIIGQIFTLFLGIGGLLVCLYLAMSGYTGAAIATIVSSFSPIIIGALRNLQRKE